ncbi:MAG: BON domain-containing protein [Chlorobium sp.]|nr:BON domain-containing protein [Chlorobium sp.]
MFTSKKIISISKVIFLSSILFLITTDKSYSQVNTDKLVNNVEDKISNYYTENFQVSADEKGVVTIGGEVGTLYDKLKIGELISQVAGVKEINNKISVQNEITANNIIKDNIENELQRNDAILEPEKIKVEVNNGIVTLSGSVSYFREKQMAESIASWQDGVSDLINNINVMSPATAKSDANLTEIIIDLLNKNYSLENNVKFDTNNGIVDLYGTVTSLYAKNHIQEDIQHIIGVKTVINEISVVNNNE